MGNYSSKRATHGTLSAAYAPPALDGVTLPEPPQKERKFRIRVPEGKKSGDMIDFDVDGVTISVKIPIGHDRKKIKAGGSFVYTKAADISKVIASTMPSIPGFEVVQSKPIIWGSVSCSFTAGSADQQSMGNMVGNLVQEVHDSLLFQAVANECNAVLSINFNITNDSSGDHGNFKQVIVTGYGTPCLVMKAGTSPVVLAEAVDLSIWGDDVALASATPPVSGR